MFVAFLLVLRSVYAVPQVPRRLCGISPVVPQSALRKVSIWRLVEEELELELKILHLAVLQQADLNAPAF
jgi:hypothetical protein